MLVLDHLSSTAASTRTVIPMMRPLVHLPIGTNGYVSTWGAITSVCPPQAG